MNKMVICLMCVYKLMAAEDAKPEKLHPNVVKVYKYIEGTLGKSDSEGNLTIPLKELKTDFLTPFEPIISGFLGKFLENKLPLEETNTEIIKTGVKNLLSRLELNDRVQMAKDFLDENPQFKNLIQKEASKIVTKLIQIFKNKEGTPKNGNSET